MAPAAALARYAGDVIVGTESPRALFWILEPRGNGFADTPLRTTWPPGQPRAGDLRQLNAAPLLATSAAHRVPIAGRRHTAGQRARPGRGHPSGPRSRLAGRWLLERAAHGRVIANKHIQVLIPGLSRPRGAVFTHPSRPRREGLLSSEPASKVDVSPNHVPNSAILRRTQRTHTTSEALSHTQMSCNRPLCNQGVGGSSPPAGS